MANKRIYEIAKEYKISSNALLKILRELKFTPKSHMSVASNGMVAAITKKFEAEKKAVKEKEAVKKVIKRKGPKPPVKVDTTKEAEKSKSPGVITKPETFAKKVDKKKKKDRRRRKDARKVDRKAVVKSFKATIATMDGPRRPKRSKKRIKSGEGFDIEEENVIEVNEFMTVAELAVKMNLKPAELIAKCFALGMMASINQRLDLETIETLSLECGYNIKESEEIGEEARDAEDEENLIVRAPVVTVMGHVDHGKTSLLDYLRKTDVVADEAGDITQHIGAYVVKTSGGEITFIDTPGHEAFTAMRARGAQITDMVILVVAADDGVMPQTIEAIDHARAANVPIIVAINKMDKPDANPDRVKQQLAKQNISPEEWGGKTVMVEVSAKTGLGIDNLLESILFQAELLDIKADPIIRGQGIVIEANLEKGRGPSCTVIIQKGTVKVGDPVCAGPYYGRVRAMLNERDRALEKVGPSQPVKLTGLHGIPQAGDSFMVVKDDHEARQIAIRRMQIKREHDMRRGFGPATLENIYEQIKEGQMKELRLIIKADVDGSAEVLSETLGRIATEEVRTAIIRKGVGAVTESDILLAATSGAVVIGFNVRPDTRARETAAREKVDVKFYDIIYEVEEDVRKALEGMLSPEIQESVVGLAEIRQVFKVPRVGAIAGCFVKDGVINRSDKVRIIRDGRVIFTGSMSSLKRFKDDVREVSNGYECGIGVEDFNDIKVGDSIETFKIVETARKLEQ
jgi:translation initiation factor IF-2